MKGNYAHSFFNLQSYHAHNMSDVFTALKNTKLVINIPSVYPKAGKSIFTDIINTNQDIGASVEYFMKCAIDKPEDEYFSKLKIVSGGQIDLSDMECYLSLMHLLACRRISTEGIEGEIRPINVSFSPPKINPPHDSMAK